MGTEVDEMGPVDYLLVEFPHGHSTFGAGLAAELRRLCHEGLIQVLDVVIIQKGNDGTVEGFEVDDLDVDIDGPLYDDIAELLSPEDVQRLAAAMEPGTVAGVVVWENVWAAPLAAVARHAGAQLIASGRIPLDDLASALRTGEECG